MPICPDCKAEYQDGITMCTDCQVALVESLPQPTPEEVAEANLYRLDELAVVADFSNASEAKMIQELLTGNKIESTLRGQEDRYFVGLTRPVSLMVEKHNLKSAREIYEAFFAGQGIPEMESAPEEPE